MTQESKSGARVRLDAAKALELSDLVAYAEGAVVSRTIVDTKACTLTLFAFDAGQTLSEHTSPFDALVYVLDGVVELAIGGVPVRATTGQVVLMPASVPHAVRALVRFKMLLTMVR
ncbi:MAG: cupin domain-containing protein [Chloroflexota bacterium]|nr:cupin domain-containing protein [Chloroflexota bacterium]